MLEWVSEKERERESKREATVIQFFLMKNVSALTAGRPISKPLHSGKSIAHLFILLFELFVHLTATGWASDKCCFKGFAFMHTQCHIRRLKAHTQEQRSQFDRLQCSLMSRINALQLCLQWTFDVISSMWDALWRVTYITPLSLRETWIFFSTDERWFPIWLRRKYMKCYLQTILFP